jgi:hypothetical protein
MEDGPFIDDFPIKTSIYKGLSMAMLNSQRVTLTPFVEKVPGRHQFSIGIETHPTAYN